jgi:hypothetical protein
VCSGGGDELCVGTQLGCFVLRACQLRGCMPPAFVLPAYLRYDDDDAMGQHGRRSVRAVAAGAVSRSVGAPHLGGHHSFGALHWNWMVFLKSAQLFIAAEQLSDV